MFKNGGSEKLGEKMKSLEELAATSRDGKTNKTNKQTKNDGRVWWRFGAEFTKAVLAVVIHNSIDAGSDSFYRYISFKQNNKHRSYIFKRLINILIK